MQQLARMTLCALLILAGTSQAVNANPAGRAILHITGATASGTEVAFDLAMLDALPQQSVATRTPWTAGRDHYSGPALNDVLRAAGVTGNRIVAYALNDYSIALNPEQLHLMVLATRQNGQPMRIRNKGPIWIMLPLDQSPELSAPSSLQQMVWQLRRLDITAE